MRKWQSTKIVEAEQIISASPATTGGVIIKTTEVRGAFDETSYLVEDAWVAKHSPDSMADGLVDGWYVRYPDGYESWHPAGYETTHDRMPDPKTMHPSVEQVFQFFAYMHLPTHLLVVSRPFHDLAQRIAYGPTNAETTVALRKLLEAKDAAVRAVVASQS